jgi:hypothetical protein
MHAARIASVGPDAPLYVVGDDLRILRTPGTLLAARVRVAAWAHLLARFGIMRPSRAWHLAACSAVFCHADAEVAARLQTLIHNSCCSLDNAYRDEIQAAFLELVSQLSQLSQPAELNASKLSQPAELNASKNSFESLWDRTPVSSMSLSSAALLIAELPAPPDDWLSLVAPFGAQAAQTTAATYEEFLRAATTAQDPHTRMVRSVFPKYFAVDYPRVLSIIWKNRSRGVYMPPDWNVAVECAAARLPASEKARACLRASAFEASARDALSSTQKRATCAFFDHPVKRATKAKAAPAPAAPEAPAARSERLVAPAIAAAPAAPEAPAARSERPEKQAKAAPAALETPAREQSDTESYYSDAPAAPEET